MRGGLEARLLFTAPSELLVAEPMSSASKRLLGSYASAARRLRSESVPAEKFRRPEALRDLDAFYASGAAMPAQLGTYVRRQSGNACVACSVSCSGSGPTDRALGQRHGHRCWRRLHRRPA